jgi:hypothetical protein
VELSAEPASGRQRMLVELRRAVARPVSLPITLPEGPTLPTLA